MSNIIFMNIKDKIPSSSHFSISEKLNNISKEQENQISLTELKNPNYRYSFKCICWYNWCG